jgi:hypothetical protein
MSSLDDIARALGTMSAAEREALRAAVEPPKPKPPSPPPLRLTREEFMNGWRPETLARYRAEREAAHSNSILNPPKPEIRIENCATGGKYNPCSLWMKH